MKDINGKDITLSASGFEAWGLCNRRWVFDKALAMRMPDDSSSLLFGTAVHYVLENYLRDGKVLTPGVYQDARDTINLTAEHITRAQHSFASLPAPGTYMVEQWLTRVPVGPFDLVGKVDAAASPATIDAPHGFASWGDAVAHIIDHKSSSNPRQWGHTPDTLADNFQGATYAAAMLRAGEIPEGPVLFTHNYVASKGGVYSKRVDTTISAEKVLSHLDRMDNLANTMADAAQAVRSVGQQDEVGYNLSGCRAFGRTCPYIDVCTAHTGKSLFAGVAALGASKTDPSPTTPTTPKGPTMKMFSKPIATPTQAAPAPAPAAPAAQAATTDTVVLVPPDEVMPVADQIRGKLLTEASRALAAVLDDDEIPYAGMQEMLRGEGIPDDYHAAIVAAVAPSLLPEGWETLTRLTPALLLAGWPHTSESLRARGSEVPDPDTQRMQAALGVQSEAPFTALVGRMPPGVLEKLRAHPDLTDVQRRVLFPATAGAGTASDAAPTDERFAQAVRLVTEEGLSPKQALVDAGYKRVPNKVLDALVAATNWTPPVEGTAPAAGATAATPATPAEAPAHTLAQEPPTPTQDDVQNIVATYPSMSPAGKNWAIDHLVRLGHDDLACELRAGDTVDAPAGTPASALSPTYVYPPGVSAEPTVCVLMIGCYARGVPSTNIRDTDVVQSAIGKVSQNVMNKHGMPWELFNDYLDSGPKRVVLEVQQAILRNPEALAPGWYYIEKGDSLVKAALATALEQAGVVIVGGAL